MSLFINVISAIGNNSSIYPLLIRDCGIENPVKIGLTYRQNLKESKEMAKDAFRERTIDEYGASAVWLGGIPLIDNICDKGIKKLGYNPNINPELFKEKGKQGLKYNIDKFKKKAPKEVAELEKILKNKKTYEKLLAGKFILSTGIPIILMGYFLPKMNFKLTNNLRKSKNNNEENKIKGNKNISFKGNTISTLANMTTVNKMAITDGGLTAGRVGTGRNKFEKWEMAFKMSMMMILNYIAPKWIAKFFDSVSNKIFNTNSNLDPKILNDKEFIESIKNGTFKLPENNIIDFLDKNPNEKFSKLAKQFYKINYLENNIRDPRSYIDENELNSFKKELENFIKQAEKSGNIENFSKKALKVKSLNILANITLSSLLLAVALPKVTFILRKLITKSDAEPGLVTKI